MFINLSNHKSETWQPPQLEAAQKYGEIIDIEFPNIPPDWDDNQVADKVTELLPKIIHKASQAKRKEQVVIHLAGEPVFCFMMANALLKRKFTVLTSTTERIVKENGQEKTSVFTFSTFRKFSQSEIMKKSSDYKTFFHNKLLVGCMIITLLAIELSIAKIMKNYTEFIDPTTINPITDWGWPYAHHTLNIIAIVFTTAFLLIFVLGLCFKIYKPSSITIRKLVTNALGFKWLSLLFVITFMMQFTWFIDASYKIFMDGEITLCNLTELFKMLMSLVSLFVVSMLFPKVSLRDKELKTQTRTLLVSTLSLAIKRNNTPVTGQTIPPTIPNQPTQIINIDLFNKLLKEEIYKSGSEISMGRLTNIEKILIIPSTELFNAHFDDTINEQFKDHEVFVKYQNEPNKEVRKVYLAECLKAIIQKEINKDVSVYFTEAVNYDDFDKFFQIVNKEINFYENRKTDATAVYISPGTKAATGALSILGIKGSRMVIYAEQGSKRLCSININVFTLEELLNEFWGEHEDYEETTT